MRCVAFLLLVAASQLLADPSAEALAFLAVPGAAWEYKLDTVHAFPISELPPRMLPVLKRYDWGIDSGLPSEFRGFTLDLNRDGKVEYFLCTPYGGSGGPAFMILTETSAGWKVIGDYQGSLHVMPAAPGLWPELLTTSRGGGDTYGKLHHDFHNGSYHPTIREGFVRGVVNKEIVPPE